MPVTRLFDLLDRYCELYPDKEDALAAKQDGQWKKYSAKELVSQAELVSYGLLAMGLQKGDKIATLSNNRPEWNFMDLGMMRAGAIHVPVYPTISTGDLKFILNDAEVKYIFVSGQELWDKLEPLVSEMGGIRGMFSFDRLEGKPHWTDITKEGKAHPDPGKIKAIGDSIGPNDLATLLYTSGTTGFPKGVMLSHDNILSQLLAAQHLAPVDEHSKALSFLPLNHVYERVLSYLYMYKGVGIYYAESIEKVADNLREVQPEIFGCVPRLFEKVYDRIMAKGSELRGIKKKLFFWAVDLGLKYELNGANGLVYEMKLKIARKLIFSKWQEALGGKVKAAVSGGAALQPRLARIFWAAQIPILEGYGLTETSPVIAVNTLDPGGLKFGTVGKAIQKVTVRIAGDGEILCKGPNVMLGYYKRPDLTAEMIDAEGWLHTGDIGELVDGVYLKITDRKKEIFKTSGGKYIVPQLIENKLKESRFIEQVMVIGENRKFAAALVVPNFAFLREWCERKEIPLPASNNELIAIERVKNRVMKEVNLVNEGLGSFESIKKIELLPREWSIDKGEMTPKLSLKRKVILELNKDLVDRIYAE
ncbi:MAG: long-chain fatty acid--CoA ligase [Bacteroidia bacterium]|nr:long-chain fatty acid--CoA ligase [Bacteroidia bacterium]